MKPSIYLLFCADKKEAVDIRAMLLEKRLIACGGIIKVDDSKYWWKKLYEEAKNEFMLLMESKEENFDKIEKEVRRLHSMETFVLLSIPIKTTIDVKKWLKEELNN